MSTKWMLYVSLITLVISSCCTEKDCTQVKNTPEIHAQFVNFSDSEIENAKIFLAHKTTFEIVDSTNLNQGHHFIVNHSYYTNHSIDIYSLKEYSFIVSTDFSIDTIYGIDYNISNSKIKCNSCFLADGRADVITISNLEVYHKGIQYGENELIQIEK